MKNTEHIGTLGEQLGYWFAYAKAHQPTGESPADFALRQVFTTREIVERIVKETPFPKMD